MDALVRPHLRRHHAGGRDGAGRLHGRPRHGQRARVAPPRRGSAAGLREARAPDRGHGAPDAAAPARPALGLRHPGRAARPHRLRRVGGDRDPRRLRAAAAHDPARCDGAARRRVPGAVGPRRSPGFRTPLPAEHARRRRGGGARSLRARSGAGSARNARRRRDGQPVDRKRGAALGARRPGGPRLPSRRRRTARRACASAAAVSSSPSRRAPRPSASKCCGRARTRS